MLVIEVVLVSGAGFSVFWGGWGSTFSSQEVGVKALAICSLDLAFNPVLEDGCSLLGRALQLSSKRFGLGFDFIISGLFWLGCQGRPS